MAEQSLPHFSLIECLQRHHNHFHAYYLHSSLFLLFVNTFFLGMSLYITWSIKIYIYIYFYKKKRVFDQSRSAAISTLSSFQERAVDVLLEIKNLLLF